MVLHKGYGGLQRLHRLRLMLHYNLLILLVFADILTDNSIRAEPQRQADDKTYRHLAHDLVLTLQAVLVFAEHLDIVVEEA